MSTASARHTDPETSREAAEHVDTERLEVRVLFALALSPMTTHQIAAYLRLPVVSVSPRIAPLRRQGKVRDSGIRSQGRSVWALVPQS
jgi:hypothetical protein